MTNKTSLLLLFIITLVSSTACDQKSGDSEMSPITEMQEMQSMDHSMHQENELDAGEPAEGSIYHVESRWNTQANDEISLSKLRGKVQVVAMVYTSCEYACPRIIADMKRIESELSNRTLDHVNFLIISIDPKRDTPNKLFEFAQDNKLSPEYWTLLNGDEGDILEMGALLGVKYKRISDIDFVHSNILTVLNKEGEVIHQRKKLNDKTEDILKVIQDNI